MQRFLRRYTYGIAGATTVILVCSGLVAATTLSAPFGSYAVTTVKIATGGSPFNDAGGSAPNPATGQMTFFQNSTAGQLGPTVASLALNQSFNESTHLSGGILYDFNETWGFSGMESESFHCFSSTGAARLYANESIELDLYLPGYGWALATPEIVSIWSYSLASTCATNSSSSHSLTGSSTFPFLPIRIPIGKSGNWEVWASLYTNTTALETSVSDVIASSCVNYVLVPAGSSTFEGCGPSSTSIGYAKLTALIVS